MQRLSSLALVPALAVAVAACGGGSKPSSGAGAKRITITLSDAGCEPRDISAAAGPTTFVVKNSGTARVTEFEVMSGKKVLGEVENVVPGTDRTFTLDLKAGDYATKCPGGKEFEAGTVRVAAASGSGTTAVGASDTRARDAAVAKYRSYVAGAAARLVDAVGEFAAAVKAHDVAAAKSLFAAAREPYETIEPVVEGFGDLDPAIDAREGDVPDAEWTGFHRIEKALWVGGSAEGLDGLANGLVDDVTRLRGEVASLDLDPAGIANGAAELLNEVSTAKVTGEEDRYSHTDLSDFAANLAGSQAAFAALRDLVAARDASLVQTIESRFAAARDALAVHRSNDPSGNGYALYTSLTPAQTRTLAAAVDAVAEPVSKIAAIVV